MAEKIRKTLTCLSNAKERNQWKREEKEARITAAENRRAAIQTEP